MADPRVNVQITGDTKDLERAYGRASSSSKSLGGGFMKMGALAAVAGGVAGVGLLTKGIMSSIKAAQASELSQKQMATQLKAVGISYQEHAKQIDQVIQKQSQLSALDDEDLQDSFTRIVRSTKDVNEALRLNALASDIARAKHMDVVAAANVVSKAYDGNVGALSRLGVAVEKGATGQEALAAAQAKFAGQAEAYGNSTAGAQEKVAVSFENLQEAIGSKLLPVFNRLLDAFNQALVWAQANWPMISAEITKFGNVVKPVLNAIVGIVRDYLMPIWKAIGTLMVQEWTAIAKVFQEHGPQIHQLLQRIGTVARAIGETLLWLAQNVVIPILKPVLTVILPAAIGITISALDKLFDIIGGVIDAIKWIGGAAIALWKKGAAAAAAAGNAIAAAFQPALSVFLAIERAIRWILDKVGEVVSALGKIHVPSWVPGFAGGVTNFGGGLAMVGESGPELVYLPQGANVYTNAQTRAMMGSPSSTGGMAGGLTVNVYTTGFLGPGAEQELANTIVRTLSKYTRRNQSLGIA